MNHKRCPRINDPSFFFFHPIIKALEFVRYDNGMFSSSSRLAIRSRRSAKFCQANRLDSELPLALIPNRCRMECRIPRRFHPKSRLRRERRSTASSSRYYRDHPYRVSRVTYVSRRIRCSMHKRGANSDISDPAIFVPSNSIYKYLNLIFAFA